MATSTSMADFSFRLVSSGAYEVTYQSWNDYLRCRYWVARIEDMTIIDATKNCDCPKKKDIEHLKRQVKRNGKQVTWPH